MLALEDLLAGGAGLPRRGWMPPHPTLYLRRSVYERLGGFDTRYRIAADYDGHAARKGACLFAMSGGNV